MSPARSSRSREAAETRVTHITTLRLRSRPPLAAPLLSPPAQPTKTVCSCSTCESSRRSPAPKRIVTTRKSAGSTTTRTKGDPWGPTAVKCASFQRQVAVQMVTHARRPTTASSLSTIPRNTRPSSATNGLAMWTSVTSATCVPLLTTRKSSQLICCTRWSRMPTSTCSTSRRSGVPSMTR